MFYLLIFTYIAHTFLIILYHFCYLQVWPQDAYPLVEVGRMVLDRNPSNYFAEVEQIAFAPAHLVPGIEPSPFFRRMGGFTGPVDHRQQIDFTPPCHVVINTRVTSIVGGSENLSAEFQVLNALTPENERSTHYFWGLMRNFALGDEAVTEMQQKLNRETFFEDLSILEQQQMLLDCKPEGWRPVAIPNDGGCLQAERLMSRLIAAENRS